MVLMLRTMVSMAEKNIEDTVEAFSWWPSDDKENHHRHYHSHWLQAHLSEVEEKIKVMVSIIEEDGDSFAERAEMYYKRRPQILKILDDLLRSYRFLAEKYHQIVRSHSERLNRFVPTSLSSSKSLTSQLRPQTLARTDTSCMASFEGTKVHFCRYMQRVMATEKPCQSVYTPRTVFEIETAAKSDSSDIDGDRDSDCSKSVGLTREEYASELMEAHLRQQAELVKGNEEKREKIKELRSQVKKLMAENEALKKTGDVKAKRDAEKPRGTLFAKFTGCTL